MPDITERLFLTSAGGLEGRRLQSRQSDSGNQGCAGNVPQSSTVHVVPAIHFPLSSIPPLPWREL